MRSSIIALLVGQLLSKFVLCSQSEAASAVGMTLADTTSNVVPFVAIEQNSSKANEAGSETPTENYQPAAITAAGQTIEKKRSAQPEQFQVRSDEGSHVDEHSATDEKLVVDDGQPEMVNAIIERPEDINLSLVRFCVASQSCESTLNERCISADHGLVCGCGQGYSRDKLTKICRLSDGIDESAAEFEAAWREHSSIREVIEDRNDKEDTFDPWKLYGRISYGEISNAIDDIEEANLKKERQDWLRQELQRIKHETPRELIVDEMTKHNKTNKMLVENVDSDPAAQLSTERSTSPKSPK